MIDTLDSKLSTDEIIDMVLFKGTGSFYNCELKLDIAINAIHT